jgi:outer membrane protein assembly factor BamB
MGRSNGGTGTVMFYFSPAITSPAVGEGRVYVCTNDGVLHAVNIKTGQDDWIARAPSGGDTFGYSSPLYADGRVYLGGLGESRRGNCYALEAATGRLVWNCRTGADNYDSSPGLAGGMVVIGSVEGTLTWIDPATGKVRWRYQLDPGFTFSNPVGDAGATYMASMNGHAYGIALPAP